MRPGWRTHVSLALACAAIQTLVLASSSGGAADSLRQKRPGAVSGTVLDMSSGAGIAGAVVQLVRDTAAGRAGLLQVSSPTGRFVFMDVAPSDVVTLRAQKVGFLGGEYGQRDFEDPGQPFAIRENDWLQKLTLPMWPTGTIEGSVLDDHGVPLIGVTVHGYQRVQSAAVTRYIAAASTHTDDLGRYRLTDLLPGQYTVGVVTSQVILPESFDGQSKVGPGHASPIVATANNRILVLAGAPVIEERRREALVYPTTFAPSSRSLSGADIVLVDRTPKANVDIRLRAVPMFTVRGSVVAPQEVVGDLILRLVRDDDQAQGLQVPVAVTRVDRRGHFVLAGVAAGDYTLEVIPNVTEVRGSGVAASDSANPMRLLRPGVLQVSSLSQSRPPLEIATLRPTVGPDRWWGRRRVSIGNMDIDGLTIVAEPTSRVTGQVVIEQRTGGVQTRISRGTSAVTLLLDPADGRLEMSGEPIADIGEAGEFTIRGVLPGKYVFRSARLLVKTVQWRGREYADSPIDVSGENVDGVSVVLTEAGATISGVVTDSLSRIATDGAVLCFPVESSQWRDYGIAPRGIRVGRVGSAGRYVLDQLPAGDYYVAAVSKSEANRWQEPEYLAKLAIVARRISVKWGDSTSHDLRRLDARKLIR